MVLNAISDTVLLWVMIFMNLVFLLFRLILRRRQCEGLRLSDMFASLAFFTILANTALLSYANSQEISYMKRHPEGPPDPQTGRPNINLDPVAFGFTAAMKTLYGQITYGCLLLNVQALWTTKAAFVALYYEIFPKNSPAIRWWLHATAVFVGCTGVATILESAFWCWPLSRSWAPSSLKEVCGVKLDPRYNASSFSTHFSSTLLIVSLPLLLLGKVELRRNDLTFVFAVVCLGILSMSASIAALVILLSTRLEIFQANSKHSFYVSALADQNAMFLAACLSPLQLRFGRKAVVQNCPLVIEVEKTWNVEFDIVESWGYRPGDPFGSDMEMRTEILACNGGVSGSLTSKDGQ